MTQIITPTTYKAKKHELELDPRHWADVVSVLYRYLHGCYRDDTAQRSHIYGLGNTLRLSTYAENGRIGHLDLFDLVELYGDCNIVTLTSMGPNPFPPNPTARKIVEGKLVTRDWASVISDVHTSLLQDYPIWGENYLRRNGNAPPMHISGNGQRLTMSKWINHVELFGDFKKLTLKIKEHPRVVLDVGDLESLLEHYRLRSAEEVQKD